MNKLSGDSQSIIELLVMAIKSLNITLWALSIWPKFLVILSEGANGTDIFWSLILVVRRKVGLKLRKIGMTGIFSFIRRFLLGPRLQNSCFFFPTVSTLARYTRSFVRMLPASLGFAKAWQYHQCSSCFLSDRRLKSLTSTLLLWIGRKKI